MAHRTPTRRTPACLTLTGTHRPSSPARTAKISSPHVGLLKHGLPHTCPPHICLPHTSPPSPTLLLHTGPLPTGPPSLAPASLTLPRLSPAGTHRPTAHLHTGPPRNIPPGTARYKLAPLCRPAGRTLARHTWPVSTPADRILVRCTLVRGTQAPVKSPRRTPNRSTPASLTPVQPAAHQHDKSVTAFCSSSWFIVAFCTDNRGY
jgi:hypothetical protein